MLPTQKGRFILIIEKLKITIQTYSVPIYKITEVFRITLCLDIDTHIVKIYGCDYRRGMDCILDLLTTCIHHSELNFTDHWHRSITVSTSRFLATDLTEEL
jgi:hypothetical protein